MELSINLLQAAKGFDASFIIMMLLLFVIMYFFMIRPQQKRQREIRKFRNSLTAGMEVVTYGGVHGVIRSIDEAANTVSLEIASGVKITVEKTHLFAVGTTIQNVQ